MRTHKVGSIEQVGISQCAQWFHTHYLLRTHSKYYYHDTLHRKMTRRYQERRKLSPAYKSQAWSAAATVRNTTSSTTAMIRSEYTCRATCCVRYLVIVATSVSRHTQVEPQVHRAQIENSNVTPAQAIRGALQHVPKRSSRTRIANVS